MMEFVINLFITYYNIHNTKIEIKNNNEKENKIHVKNFASDIKNLIYFYDFIIGIVFFFIYTIISINF